MAKEITCVKKGSDSYGLADLMVRQRGAKSINNPSSVKVKVNEGTLPNLIVVTTGDVEQLNSIYYLLLDASVAVSIYGENGIFFDQTTSSITIKVLAGTTRLTVVPLDTNIITLDTGENLSPVEFVWKKPEVDISGKLDKYDFTSNTIVGPLHIQYDSDVKLMITAKLSKVSDTIVPYETSFILDSPTHIIPITAPGDFKYEWITVCNVESGEFDLNIPADDLRIIPINDGIYSITQNLNYSCSTAETITRELHASEVIQEVTKNEYTAITEKDPRVLYIVSDENPTSGYTTLTAVNILDPSTDSITFNSSTMYE